MSALEPIRLIADRLKDRTLGVNAMLAGLTEDAPGDAIPRVAFIGDETRDEVVAAFQEPPKLPAIYVTEDGPLGMEGETPTSDHRDSLEGAGIPVAIRWLDADANLVRANQARHYALRAIVKSLATLFNTGVTVERNGIEVIGAERFEFGRWREQVGDAKVSGAVVVTLRLRDNAP